MNPISFLKCFIIPGAPTTKWESMRCKKSRLKPPSTYVSPCPDQGAVESNAFSIPWDRWDSIYLFPPVPLLSKVSSLLLQFQGRGALIAPFYAQSSWLPNLLRRSAEHHPLPPGHSLSQRTNKGRVFHPCPSVYSLHVWRL